MEVIFCISLICITSFGIGICILEKCGPIITSPHNFLTSQLIKKIATTNTIMASYQNGRNFLTCYTPI